MKIWYCFIVCLLFQANGFAQKVKLDTGIVDTWPVLDDPQISGDGMYLFYYVRYKTTDNRTLIVGSIDQGWKIEIKDISETATFNLDNKKVIFIANKDSLCYISLDDKVRHFIGFAGSFEEHLDGKRDLLGFIDRRTDIFILFDLNSAKEERYEHVVNYVACFDHGFIILQETDPHLKNEEDIKIIDSRSNRQRVIWRGSDIHNLVIDDACSKIAFIAKDNMATADIDELYLTDLNNGKCIVLVKDYIVSGIDTLFISEIGPFSRNAERLAIRLKPKLHGENALNAKVDIWSTSDAKLQSEQLEDWREGNDSFLGVIQIDNRVLFRIQMDDETPIYGSETDSILLLYRRKGNRDERNWNSESVKTILLASKINGDKQELKDLKGIVENNIHLSPDGHFIVYYNPRFKNYFSYDIRSGKTTDLTRLINAPWTLAGDEPQDGDFSLGVGGWLQDGASVILYGRYDIWVVDINGRKAPINLTCYYGEKNQTMFRLCSSASDIVDASRVMVLSAFDRRNKKNGFYSVRNWKYPVLEKLTMDNYYYYAPDAQTLVVDDSQNFRPIKAKDSNRYLVRRMSATQPPNYFVTDDFKDFQQVSFLNPVDRCEWIRDTLMQWKEPNGTYRQGILYFPESFDPKKKYPLIIHCYEKVSDGVNVFIVPELSQGPINIPWFVTNGYLVFTPDIDFETGKEGFSAYKAVVSSLNYLSQYRWFDCDHLGIQGHSFGGFEVNYIVTKTHRFKAAMSSCGASDAISSFGSLWGTGNSKMEDYELRQHRMGVTPWQNLSVYLNNSPVLDADKISTPILLMHNKKDLNVVFSQGIEFFTALRRLKKTAWMLQYDKGDHGLNYFDTNSTIDFTTRMMQFFDHYLKDGPLPIWMSKGVPASLKGYDNGLGLDK